MRIDYHSKRLTEVIVEDRSSKIISNDQNETQEGVESAMRVGSSSSKEKRVQNE